MSCFFSVHWALSLTTGALRRKASPMIKIDNSSYFLVILVSFLILFIFAPWTAFSESPVYRGSVSPQPKAQQEVKTGAAQSSPAGKVAPKKKAPVKKEQAATPKKAPARKGQATTQKKASVKKEQATTPKKAPVKKGQAATPKKSSTRKGQGAVQKAPASKEQPAKAVRKKGGSRKGQAGAAPSKATKKSGSKTSAAAIKRARAQRGGAAPSEARSGRDIHLNVKAAILINMSNGRIYYEQNPDTVIAPASITKVLTLYLVREALAQGRLSLDTPIPVSDRAVQTGGSRMRLKRGEAVPLEELIKGISVVSANNACVAVAEYMSKGEPQKFVAQMNAKARTLGMTRSLFKNPNGLPAKDQLSTARDIATLSMSYLRTFPKSLTVHSMTSHTYHGATHRNANSLLRTYDGADGLKTGFVCASGYNIAATAKRGDTRLLAVVLGAQNSSIRHVETTRLLNYGFKRAAQDNTANRPDEKPAV